MNTTQYDTLKICPINFSRFNEILDVTSSVDEAIMFSRFIYHNKFTKLTKNGKKTIARSRSEITKWFGFSKRKVDSTIQSLSSAGLIEKLVSTWYGKKALFISTSDSFSDSPVNFKLLDLLIGEIGCYMQSIIFSKILYMNANSKITQEGEKWCSLRKADLANWLGISIRSLDKHLQGLIANGYILKKNYVRHERRVSHFRVGHMVIKSIVSKLTHVDKNKDVPTTSCKICRKQPAKTPLSTKVRTNSKKQNNITGDYQETSKSFNKKEISVVTLSEINGELNPRQIAYMKSALMRTQQKFNLKISNPQELISQLKYSLVNKQQIKRVSTFQHAVSRFMKIISSGNWRTPYGYKKYDPVGIRANKQEVDKRKYIAESKSKESDTSIIKSIASKFSEYKTKLFDTHSQSTEKAIGYARTIMRLRMKNADEGVIELYLHKIKEQIQCGADRLKVRSALRSK